MPVSLAFLRLKHTSTESICLMVTMPRRTEHIMVAIPLISVDFYEHDTVDVQVLFIYLNLVWESHRSISWTALKSPTST